MEMVRLPRECIQKSQPPEEFASATKFTGSAPDVMRFGFSALPLSFAEVARAADLLVEVVATRAYDDPKFRIRAKVT